MVTTVGLGAMSFADFYGPVTEEQSMDTLRAMLELGIDHLDTSNVYGMGRSESIIGKFLAGLPPSDRAPFRIATKSSIKRDPQTQARSFDNSPEHMTAELDASLKRLGVERIDLYYAHRRDERFEIEEVTETLAGFVKSGKVAAIGFSEIAPASLRRAAAVHPIAAVQSEYSLATRLPELGLIRACEEVGAALVAFSPVGRAMLTDTPPDAARVQVSPFFKASPRFTGGNLERNLAASEPLRRVAAEAGVPTAALAIAWVLEQSDSIIAIPGTKRPEHLKELVQGAEMSLTDDLRRAIDEAMPAGWSHGARYSLQQMPGTENYC